LNPAEINEITILRGDEAARRYGATAGVVGVVVITMRDHGAQAVRRAST
jgi:hypothetical protein